MDYQFRKSSSLYSLMPRLVLAQILAAQLATTSTSLAPMYSIRAVSTKTQPLYYSFLHLMSSRYSRRITVCRQMKSWSSLMLMLHHAQLRSSMLTHPLRSIPKLSVLTWNRPALRSSRCTHSLLNSVMTTLSARYRVSSKRTP